MLLDMKKENKEQYLLALEIYMDYTFDGTEPELSGQPLVMKLFWKAAKPLIDANNRNYVNGCKGGAPAESMKGNQNARKNPKQTQNKPKTNPKQTQNKGNDNVNDNVKDNVHVNVHEHDNDNDNVNVNVNKEKDICPYVNDEGIITNWEKFHEWESKHPDWKWEDE